MSPEAFRVTSSSVIALAVGIAARLSSQRRCLNFLGNVFAEFPYHPNWKGGQTHPAVLSRAGVIDHVDPGAQGGSWLDTTNLVTACWPCNARKADLSLARLGWILRDAPTDGDWDGLTSFYPLLWETAGRPKAAPNIAWMKAFGVTVPSV
jgi:hypothetical protein